jgi:uncharacterized protein YutE (UPF0331/DUF86 family)
MSKLNPNTLARKIERMIERMNQLAAFRRYTLDQYLENENNTQIIVERLLELVIQSALDINKFLLKQVTGRSVEKNYDSFISAGEAGFISTELAQKLAPSGSFRNILAHEYDDIEPEEVFKGLQKALGICIEIKSQWDAPAF